MKRQGKGGEKRRFARTVTYFEELSGTPIDTDTLALVQIRLVVLCINAFGMTRVNQSVTVKRDMM